jgi:hypothetical protein
MIRMAILGVALGVAASAAAPTFNKDIAPILYTNCAGCHRPGEVAPFSLLTYQDAAKRASFIAAAVEKRFMPPWKAEPGYGDFANERRLSDEQVALIKEWAHAGAPEGDPAARPEPPKFPDGWQAGQPDQVFQFPAKYTLAADGPDQFRCFVISTGLDHDAYVRGLEFRPDNRRVVHHALVFLDASGRARELAAKSPDGSYSCFGGPGVPVSGLLGGWAPGAAPQRRDPSMSVPLRKGTDLVVQIHYHPSGKAELDQSSLGLVYAGPPTKGLLSALMFNRYIDIQPGDAHYVVKTSLVLPRDVTVVSITPHAHYLATDMKITAHLPDGTTKPLIWIKDWDFNWQGAYIYRDPFQLPKDTRVDLEYVYDNSEKNPHNPIRPPVRVRFGEQTKDEMAVAFLTVVLPSRDDIPEFQREIGRQLLEEFVSQWRSLDDLPAETMSPQQAEMLTRAFKLFDKDQDGRLDDGERAALLKMVQGFLQRRQ